MSFQALHDRVVIRRLEGEEKTKGGASSFRTPPRKSRPKGIVIAVGPGARDEQGKRILLDVKASDHILFGKWSGAEVKLDGEDLLIIKESDIMGVVKA
jgi:chaperonin GroES